MKNDHLIGKLEKVERFRIKKLSRNGDEILLYNKYCNQVMIEHISHSNMHYNSNNIIKSARTHSIRGKKTKHKKNSKRKLPVIGKITVRFFPAIQSSIIFSLHLFRPRFTNTFFRKTV